MLQRCFEATRQQITLSKKACVSLGISWDIVGYHVIRLDAGMFGFEGCVTATRSLMIVTKSVIQKAHVARMSVCPHVNSKVPCRSNKKHGMITKCTPLTCPRSVGGTVLASRGCLLVLAVEAEIG